MPDKGSSSYREAWKASKEQQNSLVFNFVGAKKDVSHIENDGLDLSSRAKSQGKVRKSLYCDMVVGKQIEVKDKDQGFENNQRRSLRSGQYKGAPQEPRPEVRGHIIWVHQPTTGTCGACHSGPVNFGKGKNSIWV